MARLPQPGSDDGTWGDILNTYLSQVHNSDGTLKNDVVTATTIQTGAVAETKLDSGVQTKLNATPPVSSVSGKTGAVSLNKTDVGLDNVDNTADADKPISTVTQAALDARVVWVDVVDENTVRPTGATRVMWIGGTIQPLNMLTGDVWFKEGA